MLEGSIGLAVVVVIGCIALGALLHARFLALREDAEPRLVEKTKPPPPPPKKLPTVKEVEARIALLESVLKTESDLVPILASTQHMLLLEIKCAEGLDYIMQVQQRGNKTASPFRVKGYSPIWCFFPSGNPTSIQLSNQLTHLKRAWDNKQECERS